jgi:hypothetical protein
MRLTKQEVIDEICDILSVPRLMVSNGSTEPKELFVLVSEMNGLDLDKRLSKPDMAQAICERAGIRWLASCSSTGSTVTLKGLLLVLEATKRFRLL